MDRNNHYITLLSMYIIDLGKNLDYLVYLDLCYVSQTMNSQLIFCYLVTFDKSIVGQEIYYFMSKQPMNLSETAQLVAISCLQQ
jgi:hypothetical protein